MNNWPASYRMTSVVIANATATGILPLLVKCGIFDEGEVQKAELFLQSGGQPQRMLQQMIRAVGKRGTVMVLQYRSSLQGANLASTMSIVKRHEGSFLVISAYRPPGATFDFVRVTWKITQEPQPWEKAAPILEACGEKLPDDLMELSLLNQTGQQIQVMVRKSDENGLVLEGLAIS